MSPSTMLISKCQPLPQHHHRRSIPSHRLNRNRRNPLQPSLRPCSKTLRHSGTETRGFLMTSALVTLLRSRTWLACFCVLACFTCSVVAQEEGAVKYDSATISGLPARNIGSAMMSGRIAAVTAINENGRITVFVGSASGGVWKSINGGSTFKSVFDDPDVQSIGAVTIDRKNPKIVWVGTGESWVRNSVSVGDGIYKSTDGGENFSNVGLKDSEHISRILVDPKNDNTVYACALGHLWNDNDERGVYKTTDGGKTWRKVLAGANGSTGCALLTMNPQDA